MGQIPLPFSAQLTSEDFIVTQCNEPVAEMLRNWRHWPYRSAVLFGPEKSGKTAMGQVFAAQASGVFIDDAEQYEEVELFHEWNVSHAAGKPILLATGTEAFCDKIKLPDLASRLNASQHIKIDPPDEAMTSALFQKLCHQCGFTVSERSARYVMERSERSYGAVAKLVSDLNRWALANQKPVGIKIIGELLDQYPADMGMTR